MALDPLTDLQRAADRRVRLAPPGASIAGPPMLDLDTLVEIAGGLATAEDLWRPHVRHDPLSRTSVRLLATAAYEVWLLGWTPGQQVELHDHGGSHAAFAVLDGELTEVTLGPTGTTVDRWRVGEVATVAAGTVHDVVNRTATDAASLHVYSSPLTSMTFFEPDGTPRHREVVEPVPALLDATRSTRALHPAGADR